MILYENREGVCSGIMEVAEISYSKILVSDCVLTFWDINLYLFITSFILSLGFVFCFIVHIDRDSKRRMKADEIFWDNWRNNK